MNEPDKISQAFIDLKKALSTLSHEVTGLRALSGNWEQLYYRSKEAAARAAEYEARADRFEKQADYARRLEHVAVGLVAALDSLPTKMEHADMIPSSHPPDVALYGTYSWQNVVDAARLVKQVLGTCGE